MEPQDVIDYFGEYYSPDFDPVMCPFCNCIDIVEEVRDQIDSTVTERSYSCHDCEEDLGYWAYGSFSPEDAIDALKSAGMRVTKVELS